LARRLAHYQGRGHSPRPAYVPRDEYPRAFPLTLDLRCAF